MFSAVLFFIAYIVVALAALPLAMRMVPPNRYYGFRTPRCLDDSTLWYTVNAVGGQLLIATAGICLILFIFYQGTWLRGFWAQLFFFIIPIAAAIGATLYFERRGGSWK